MPPTRHGPLAAAKGQELRRLRKHLGWRQAELAERLHVTRETIGNWESGQWPEPLTERGLAASLGKPTDYFERHARQTLGFAPLPSVPAQGAPEILTQLEMLMEAPPQQQIHETLTIADVQNHLRSEIAFFLKLAMPNGSVTAEGVRRARELIQTEPPTSAKQ